ncbi:MAG: hypothetical protein M4579_007013 [Chaenotheca gracillima]|nr:MAG: hypothetical protein M4579_007013 [Chaenotheca gracillima]
MASISTTGKESRHTSYSTERAIEKLLDTFKLVQYRDAVKPHQEKRVREAFSLLAAPPLKETSKSAERRNSYRLLLKRVDQAVGPQAVALCVVGLGQSVISGMRDQTRMDFVAEVENRKDEWACDVLQKLVDECVGEVAPIKSADNVEAPSGGGKTAREQRTGSLTGEVYGLTAQDARAIAMSNQDQGAIWLTVPFEMGSKPFITIPISRDTSRQYAAKRQRIM